MFSPDSQEMRKLEDTVKGHYYLITILIVNIIVLLIDAGSNHLNPALTVLLISVPFVVVSIVLGVLTVKVWHKREMQLLSEYLKEIHERDYEIESLTKNHKEEVTHLNEKHQSQVDNLIDRIRELRQSNVDTHNDQDDLKARILSKRLSTLVEENNELKSQNTAYEKRIEDLQSLQQIRLECNLKQQAERYDSALQKAREKEDRLAIIIRELIESACDCEIPIDTPSGSSSPVPCVYVTKDKIWHITKHRTVSDARTIALHEALLKGYGGCPRCLKNLPPYFRF